MFIGAAHARTCPAAIRGIRIEAMVFSRRWAWHTRMIDDDAPTAYCLLTPPPPSKLNPYRVHGFLRFQTGGGARPAVPDFAAPRLSKVPGLSALRRSGAAMATSRLPLLTGGAVAPDGVGHQWLSRPWRRKVSMAVVINKIAQITVPAR